MHSTTFLELSEKVAPFKKSHAKRSKIFLVLFFKKEHLT